MLTDAPPRTSYLTGFRESDRITTLDLPEDARLSDIAKAIESAMKSDQIRNLRRACAEFLKFASEFYHVPDCGVRVLAARPLRVREQWTTELFGDYDPEAMLIRVWMRTAVRKDVTSYGTFLSTLCHEFCHHLDYKKFGFADSWHTRGFYERTAVLYHHARGTPQKHLFWAPISRRPLAHRLAQDESKYAMSDAAHRHLKPAVLFQLFTKPRVKLRLNTEPQKPPIRTPKPTQKKQGDSQDASRTFRMQI